MKYIFSLCVSQFPKCIFAMFNSYFNANSNLFMTAIKILHNNCSFFGLIKILHRTVHVCMFYAAKVFIGRKAFTLYASKVILYAYLSPVVSYLYCCNKQSTCSFQKVNEIRDTFTTSLLSYFLKLN